MGIETQKKGVFSSRAFDNKERTGTQKIKKSFIS
jgi:hypothetical protein